MDLKRLSAVVRLLTVNGADGFVRVAAPNSFTVGATVNLTSTTPLTANGLQVADIKGVSGSTDVAVYLIDPATNLSFNASAYLTSAAATLTSPIQTLWLGVGSDEASPYTIFTDAQMQAIMLAILPGAATAAANVAVTNFPASQPVSLLTSPLPAGAATETTLGSILAKLNASVAVTGAFFQATQPVSAAALPLPTGASTETTLAALSAKFGAIGQQVMAASASVVIASNQSAVPISAASLPLPTGAATQTTLASILAALQGTLTSTVSGSVSVSNFPATQPISAAALPLPTGAATSAAQTDGSQKTQVTVLPSLPTGTNTIGKTDQGLGGASAWKVDGSAVTQPISAASLPLPTGAATETTLALRATEATLAAVNAKLNSLTRPALANEAGLNVRPTFGEDQVTAFGRLTVSEPTPMVALDFNYSINPYFVTTEVVSTGTVTQASGMAVLQTGTGAAGMGHFHSKEAVRYLAGTGIYASFSALFTAGVINSRQEIGFGDDDNGMFFGFNGSLFGVFLRSATADAFYAQTTWNGVDKFDGTGPSGATLDKTRMNVYKVQLAWHGGGPIRYFIADPNTGRFTLVHTVAYANTAVVPSLLNPTLPLHAKVINLGNATNLTLKTASMGGYVEGPAGMGAPVAIGAIGGTESGKTVTNVQTALLTLLNKATNVLGGVNINKTRVKLLRIGLANGDKTDDFRFKMLLNTTLGGAPSFVDFDTSTSVIAVDTAGTTVTGGRPMGSIRQASASTQNIDLTPYNIVLAPGDAVTVSGQNLSNSTADPVEVSLTWVELF